MSRFAKAVLIDTGFWYALYDPRGRYHAQAVSREDTLQSADVLLPWPCLYETFNTRFANNRLASQRFEIFLRQPHVLRISDEPYRDAALEAAFDASVRGERSLALVDMVIRLILDDVTVRKHGILTFNPGDFADLCQKHQIEMI